MKKLKVKLERFDKTDLEKDLDKIYGRESPETLIYNDIYKTYDKYMWKEGTTDITILTDLVPKQIYKVGIYKIKIEN